MSGWILTLGSVDERLLHAVVLRRRRGLDLVMTLNTHLGDWRTVVPLALLLILGVFPTLEATGRIAAWALASSHLVVQLLKRTIDRRRPCMPMGLRRLVEPQDRFSFPSGHAAAGLSMALPFFLTLPLPLAVVVLVLGLGVGVSRCYIGVHYPGDVLVGWALALLGVLTAAPGLALLG